jgi:hypothetical protein
MTGMATAIIGSAIIGGVVQSNAAKTAAARKQKPLKWELTHK